MAFATGIIKSGQLPQTRQLVLNRGATNVASLAAWSVVSSSGMLISVSSGGLVTLLDLTINSSTAIIRGTLNGVNYDFLIPASRTLDGFSSMAGSTTLFFPSSDTITVLGTSAEFAVGANAAMTVAMDASWQSTGSGSTGGFFAQHSVDGGASWAIMGEGVSATAFMFEPARVGLNRTLAPVPFARLVRFRIQGSMFNNNDVFDSRISAMWVTA